MIIQTYTIVIDTAADLLAACVPDGDQDGIVRELRDYHDQSSAEYESDFRVINGLILTDDEPDDESRIKWRGLTDKAGTSYRYAIRPRYQHGPSAGQL